MISIVNATFLFLITSLLGTRHNYIYITTMPLNGHTFHIYACFYSLLIKTSKHLLSSERAALGQLGLTTGWGAQDGGAVVTGDSGLCVGEDSGDVQAALALDVHEIGSWALHQHLLLVFLSFSSWVWVQQVLN